MLAKTPSVKPERRAANLGEAIDLKSREHRALQWREENRDAIAYHRERIEREGMWHRGMTRWY